MVSNNVRIPKGTACQYGKQEINPESVTRKSKDKGVEYLLNRNQLEPRKFIFSDQCESSLPGILFGNRGYNITSQVYKGDTIFCDSTSKNISVHHQVSFTAE